jgi:hypothetical protein
MVAFMRLSRLGSLLPLFVAAAFAAEPVPEKAPGGLRLGSFTAYSENDNYLWDTDQFYTNGFKLTFLSADLASFAADGVPGPIRRLGSLVPPGHGYKLGFSLGQNIYTPADITVPFYQPDDRPYSAWLYFGLAFHVVDDTDDIARLDIYEVDLGVVGPSALGRQFQNGYHQIIDIPGAQGWDHQIHDEPGVNLVYERRYRFSTASARTGWGADLIPHAGLALGNIFTYANAGAEVRAGWRLPADFGSNLIRPSGDSNSDATPPPFAVFAFAAVDGRAVARDLTLDGNSFRDSPSIEKKNLVADAHVGVGIAFGRWQLRYAQAFRTREFDGQDSAQIFGSVSATCQY